MRSDEYVCEDECVLECDTSNYVQEPKKLMFPEHLTAPPGPTGSSRIHALDDPYHTHETFTIHNISHWMVCSLFCDYNYILVSLLC